MTPLTRLLETSDDELELALLRSARDEAPHETGLRDTALALGLTATTAKALADSLAASHALSQATATHAASLGAAGTSAAASVGSASVVGVAKFLVAGALVSFGAMTTIDHVISPAPSSVQPAGKPAQAAAARSPASLPALASQPPTERPAAPVEPEAAHDAPLEAGSPKPSHLKRDPAPASPGAAATPSPEAVLPQAIEPVPAPSAATTAAPPSNASLAAEIRLLDRTRAALAAGNAASARSLLRAYDESRPSAVLSHEANLLRVRLLLAEGDRRGAAALARRIIAQHPESHHGDSLRSLAAEP